eukprot:1202276-Rhodomonas_salina.2
MWSCRIRCAAPREEEACDPGKRTESRSPHPQQRPGRAVIDLRIRKLRPNRTFPSRPARFQATVSHPAIHFKPAAPQLIRMPPNAVMKVCKKAGSEQGGGGRCGPSFMVNRYRWRSVDSSKT